MKETFLLGAGFSKWYSSEMPLLKDLVINLSNELKEDISKHNILNILLNKERNVEKLLSYLYTEYPWKSEDEILLHKSLYLRVIKEVAEYLLISQDKVDYLLRLGSSKEQLISYWYNNQSDILTLNYDNILERSFSNICGKYDWYFFYQLPINHLSKRSKPVIFEGSFLGEPTRPPSVPRILKLHGSINWLFSGDFSDKNDTNIYHYNPFNISEIKNLNRQGLHELIIPPTLEKSSYITNSLIKCIWQDAKQIIGNANEVYIIGYSFPLSDIYMDLFLKTSINENTTITIVDINETKVFKEKIRDVFSVVYKRGKQKINFIVGPYAVDNFINMKCKNFA